jgi:predicted amidohydrolase
VVSGSTRLAVAQLQIDEGAAEGNAARCHAALTAAADDGAELLVFPECALTGYRYATRDAAFAAAIHGDDARLDQLARAAVAHGITVVVGFLERAGDALHNSAAILGADGAVHHARKTHLPILGADRFVMSGDRLGAVIDLPFGRLGVAICYDFRFPEVCRALALGGADVIAVPVNWSTEVARFAEHVVPTRAIENRVFVAIADRAGVVDGVTHLAASRVVDPAGVRLTAPLDPALEIAVATVDVNVSDARAKSTVFTPGAFEIDVFADRRPDLYGALAQEQSTDA